MSTAQRGFTLPGDSPDEIEERIQLASSTAAALADVATITAWMHDCTGEGHGAYPFSVYEHLAIHGGATIYLESCGDCLGTVTAVGRVGRVVVTVDMVSQVSLHAADAKRLGRDLTISMDRLAAAGY